MSLPDIVFNKIYRIVDTIPYVGTIYAVSRAVWYGFQDDVKEVAISAVNAVQGTIGDIFLFRRIAEPFKISVIRTMMQNDAKCIRYGSRRKKNTMETCFEEMWHRAIVHGSSYSGVVTYDPYMNKNMIVIAFPNGLNLNTPFGKLNLFIADKYNNIVATSELQINIANNIRYIISNNQYISVEKIDNEYKLVLKNRNIIDKLYSLFYFDVNRIIIYLKTGLAFTFDISQKTYEIKLKNINFKKDKQNSQLWEVDFFKDNHYRLRSFVSTQRQRMFCIGEDLHMWDFVNYLWNLEKVNFVDE
ncbi:27539_t:CDS:2 [Dentiscutata erythropus]|uniref:27539_t:CDS:1 n=1 Tax=Dentiscutata erythropus TaxID=1348616 RepID=A0A9N9N5I9_9GLOM|nr:27539_t:CDS:2 [Dentiscutata erythropus]